LQINLPFSHQIRLLFYLHRSLLFNHPIIHQSIHQAIHHNSPLYSHQSNLSKIQVLDQQNSLPLSHQIRLLFYLHRSLLFNHPIIHQSIHHNSPLYSHQSNQSKLQVQDLLNNLPLSHQIRLLFFQQCSLLFNLITILRSIRHISPLCSHQSYLPELQIQYLQMSHPSIHLFLLFYYRLRNHTISRQSIHFISPLCSHQSNLPELQVQYPQKSLPFSHLFLLFHYPLHNQTIIHHNSPLYSHQSNQSKLQVQDLLNNLPLSHQIRLLFFQQCSLLFNLITILRSIRHISPLCSHQSYLPELQIQYLQMSHPSIHLFLLFYYRLRNHTISRQSIHFISPLCSHQSNLPELQVQYPQKSHFTAIKATN
jgi:hypothetical protein